MLGKIKEGKSWARRKSSSSTSAPSWTSWKTWGRGSPDSGTA